MNAPFEISGSSQPTQVFKTYQQIDVASQGMYGASLKSNRRTAVRMMAGDGGDNQSFFDFKCGMLDGSGEKTMGELTKGKKAILIVNVASE